MTEKLIDAKLCKGVKDLGGMAVKLLSLTFTGFPDRTILLPGPRIYFAELKTTGKKPSPRQNIVIAWLRKLGFAVYVIDSQETLDAFFTDVRH